MADIFILYNGVLSPQMVKFVCIGQQNQLLFVYNPNSIILVGIYVAQAKFFR